MVGMLSSSATQFREMEAAQSSEVELRLKLSEQKALEHYQKAIEAEELAAALERELREHMLETEALQRQLLDIRGEATEIDKRLVEAQRCSQELTETRDQAITALAETSEQKHSAELLAAQLTVRLLLRVSRTIFL